VVFIQGRKKASSIARGRAWVGKQVLFPLFPQ
jgi:hypothetical protein